MQLNDDNAGVAWYGECLLIFRKRLTKIAAGFIEVARAAELVRSLAENKVIEHVETSEDAIVFSGISNSEFADELTGRTVKSVGRYGKVFYLELDGDGRMPVLHFGMTGMLQVKGTLPLYYRAAPRKASIDWPPRFMKFILHIRAVDAPPDEHSTQIAFLDARRLGRIRLCQTPLTEPPISNMGFDPILGMPDLEDFRKSVLKRTCPIKALLLDQSFSAGVGNWVADEILYHARVHPEQRCNTLTDEQTLALHHQTSEVCRFAVSVNADDSKFPEDWLFKHRWGKGKKSERESVLKLPSGQPATIRWITVGGRTSAYVVELQHLRSPSKTASLTESIQQEDAAESDLTPVSGSDTEPVVETTKSRGKKVRRSVVPVQSES
ncbi:AtMMH-1 [Vararia minispora EC-137]|uniref:AtMMH-1 n=1 Tax=Vararia minispora EC-137 TaxID=1314806 RepID=A0ACB8QQV4_9AGAM|nr:AtMMH-1 [Vararia minispora EC-137]